MEGVDEEGERRPAVLMDVLSFGARSIKLMSIPPNTVDDNKQPTDPPSQLAFKRYFPPGPFSNLPRLNAFCKA